MTEPRFKSVIIDVDSTLSAVEGIDWLASQRGDDVRARVSESTDRAMRGEIKVEEVFASRLRLVAPTRQEVAALSATYLERVERGAARSIAMLADAGIHVALVSGGIQNAILPLARHLGISDGDVHAVSVQFTDEDTYAGFDEESPLSRNGGKAEVVRSLGLGRPTLGVGDGITDLEMRTAEPRAVDAFAAYVGVIDRAVVRNAADFVIRSFDELPGIVFRD